MSNPDAFETGDATPAECMRKAASLRLIAKMLDPGRSQDRAICLAEMWEPAAQQQPVQEADHGQK